MCRSVAAHRRCVDTLPMVGQMSSATMEWMLVLLQTPPPLVLMLVSSPLAPPPLPPPPPPPCRRARSPRSLRFH